jgi:conjugative transposon TraN protein
MKPYKTPKNTINMNQKFAKFTPYWTIVLLLLATHVFAQSTSRRVPLPAGATLHILSPEPIRYVDIAGQSLEGDLPLNNVLRLKLKDSVTRFSAGLITIAGEKFIVQYLIVPGDINSPAQVNIDPSETWPLDISGVGLSRNQLKRIALEIISRKPSGQVEKVKSFHMKGQVNQVYAFDDYIFLDVSYRNKTNLSYHIEDIRFSLDDKKVTKASNVQSFDLKPVFVLLEVPAFAKSYRNVFVLRKLAFPGNKVLRIELGERQPSGRMITLKLSYQDILKADPLPN